MDFWVALRNSIAIRSHKGCSGHAVQVVVLWGVSGPLEHVQHAASDNKSAENVNEGDEGGGGRQALGGVGGVEPASHHQKTTLKMKLNDQILEGHSMPPKGPSIHLRCRHLLGWGSGQKWAKLIC